MTGSSGGAVGASAAGAMIGYVIGSDSGKKWKEIDYIKLGISGKYTTVLVKKYDSDGDRNLDDDDIGRLVEILEKV